MSQGEINRILEPPFSSSELGYIPGGLGSFYAPEFQYKREAEIEVRRLESLSVIGHSPQEVKNWLQRRNILTRHNIKRRWQKLGIWNPEWGIPGRDINTQPSDHLSCWNGPWAGPDPPRQFIFDSHGKNVPNPDHAITKVLQPRQGLRRGEHLPVPSHPKPQPHASASDADAFITSRPWFQFHLELQEEGQREHRLSWQQEEYLYRNQPSDHSPIIERWKNRGIWKEEWEPLEQGSSGENLPQIGWKWRHESPSPEPENLTQLRTLESMEFTPSEADALDDLPSLNPSPPPPRIVDIRSPTSGAGVFSGGFRQ